MKKELNVLSFFMLLVIASESHVQSQISDIKKESKENEAKKAPDKKPPAQNQQGQTTPVIKQVIEYHVIEPIHQIPDKRIPPSEEEETETEISDFDFDCCYSLFGCLNPALFCDSHKIRKLDSLSWDDIDPSFVSWDIRANFDLGYHYSSKKNYTYADYLPGVRMNLGLLMFDFRFNILTEYTDDYPDSFKSWELLALFNLIPQNDLRLIIGTGIHHEQFSNRNFNEYYIGAKFGLNNNKVIIDTDLRASIDYKTKVFPFFETGFRFYKQVLEINNFCGYIVIGPVYQNYYQTHDIWSMRGGIVLNIH